MSELCKIEFEDSPSKVVYAGQLLKGTVIITMKAKTIIQGVFLRFEGKALAKRNIYSSETPQYKNPTGSERYLDEKMICFDGRREKVQLEAGIHRYAFECQLTSMLPTSTEEKYGHIRYTIGIHFNEFWDQMPIHEELFTMIKPLNLNHLSNLHQPFSTEHKQKFYILCCLPCFESDELTIAARINQQGYTPGQNIDLQLNIHNKSTEEVSNILVQIIKDVKFMFNETPTNDRYPVPTEYIDSVELSDQILDGFETKDTKMKTYMVHMVVPSTAPTDETSSRIIKICYKLRIYAVVGLCHSDACLDIPITIGTYPIDEYNNSSGTSSNVFLRKVDEIEPNNEIRPTAPLLESTTSNTGQSNTNAEPKLSARYPQADPPTYEDAMSGNNADGSFRPKYPVYLRNDQ